MSLWVGDCLYDDADELSGRQAQVSYAAVDEGRDEDFRDIRYWEADQALVGLLRPEQSWGQQRYTAPLLDEFFQASNRVDLDDGLDREAALQKEAVEHFSQSGGFSHEDERLDKDALEGALLISYLGQW